MDRRTFIAVLVTEFLAGTGESFAQPAGVARVGILVGGRNPRSAPFYVAFEQRLKELGWIEGRNLVIDFQSNVDDTRAAEAMVRSRIDVIVAVGPETGIKLASAATKSTPIANCSRWSPPPNSRHSGHSDTPKRVSPSLV